MKIVHVAPWMQTSDPRIVRARDTWRTLYDDFGWVSVIPGTSPNSSDIGDARNLLLIKQLLNQASLLSTPGDLLVLTCDDIILRPCIDRAIRELSQRCPFFTGHRIDCDTYEEGLNTSDGTITNIGRVLVGCQRDWYSYHQTYKNEFPDLYCGTSRADLCLAAMARKLAGKPWTKETSGIPEPACELLAGCIYHERHAPTWSDTMPADQHDAKIVLDWFEKNMPESTPAYMKG